MDKLLAITAIGADRAGLIRDLSQAVSGSGGSIRESRMIALGSEFAILMLVAGIAYDYSSEGGTAFVLGRTFARYFDSGPPNNAALFIDPEIPVDIYELGLIYEVKIDKENNVLIDMTLTSPNCPVAESLPKDVEDKVAGIPEVASAKVNIVFEPPWDKNMMSEEAQLELGFM